MHVHEWRDRTDADELRLVRARRHGGRWRITARLKSEQAFVELDPPPLSDLLALVDIMAGKYRRGRVPHAHLIEVEALVEQAQRR